MLGRWGMYSALAQGQHRAMVAATLLPESQPDFSFDLLLEAHNLNLVQSLLSPVPPPKPGNRLCLSMLEMT